MGFFTLNKTKFELFPMLLHLVRTWIGVNNIEPLNPEVWFEEVNVPKEGGRGQKMDGIWISYHAIDNSLSPPPIVTSCVKTDRGGGSKMVR